jgi:signal transduction histidine kinase
MAPQGERLTATLWRKTRWLLSLRWVAAAGVFVVVTAARFVLRMGLPLPALYIGIGVLGLSNCIYTLWFRRLQRETASRDLELKAALFINLQVALDLTLLTYLLHFSGGIGNPFIFFFVFHMVIASILLSRVAAYLQATWATTLFALLLAGEALGFLPSYRIPLVIPPQVILSRPAYTVGLIAAFASTVFITVYLTTRIADTLRQREAELKRAVDDLVTANASLEQKDREKSLYVQRVSHDIKGSLSAIQSCLRVVLDGLLGVVGTKVADMVVRAERRSLSLLRYVNELLYLSSLRAEDRLVTLEVRKAEVVEQVTRELRAAFQDKAVDLLVRDDTAGASFRADPQLVAELIRHLLDNALKYTPRGGRVSVHWRAQEEKQALQLAVTDNGIGIQPEDLPHVFEDFYAADIPENREGTGAGLGLSIARRIVEMHGGSIAVESRPGVGSTYMCLFPAIGRETQGG